jgi:leucyl aminopeptidase (aminopeptidase T)
MISCPGSKPRNNPPGRITKTPLDRAAERTIRECLRLRRGESLLLVTDEAKLDIAELFAGWAKKAGAETTTYLMTESLRPITAPTRLLRRAAEKASCIIYALEARIEEKPLRSYLVKTGMRSSRILMMPGITRDMMERLVDIDYRKMHLFTQRIIRALRDADHIKVENSAGTSLEFSVAHRKWMASTGDISRKGHHGNLPAGEAYTAPVEKTFTGTIALSLIDDQLGPGIMEFRKGRLIRWKGKGVETVLRNIGADETGKIIGEFGIGTNRGARVCPNMLEAEKAFGTAHFAIGDSYGLGKNSSRHHYDALVEKVTITVNGVEIVRNGRFLL